MEISDSILGLWSSAIVLVIFDYFLFRFLTRMWVGKVVTGVYKIIVDEASDLWTGEFEELVLTPKGKRAKELLMSDSVLSWDRLSEKLRQEGF